MKVFKLVSLGLLLVLLNGCATANSDIKAEAVADPKVNLAAYKTYAWAGSVSAMNDPEGVAKPAGFDEDAEMRFLIDAELRARGKMFAEQDPDLLVAYMLVIDMNVQKDEIAKRYGKKADMSKLHEGAIIVGLIDPNDDKTVWVGAAQGQVKNQTGEAAKARVAAAIKKIFANYPK